MNLAVMQPYLFPYIGYWQLINAVDTFVIYDNLIKDTIVGEFACRPYIYIYIYIYIERERQRHAP